MDTFRQILSIFLLSIVIYYSYQIQTTSKLRQENLIEHSEIRSIKYGLLSVYEWKRQVSRIITVKVKNFKLTESNRSSIRENIQNILHNIIDELDRILENKANQGGIFSGAIKRFVQSLFFNVNDLRNRVPQFTEIILDELDNYKSRDKLRKYIQAKIEELLFQTVGYEDLSKINEIESKYSCSGIPGCGEVIQEKLKNSDAQLQKYSLIIIVLSSLGFLILFWGNRYPSVVNYCLAIFYCIILLLSGINTPMIEIDARIADFNFLLMGESVEFSNQILFFQSKSILEVVQILITTYDFKSKLVGGLIFVFSVVFPVLKLASTALLINNKKYQKNRLIYFLAIKSGKWSLADVVVVAIFMSYIGFKGILENQLTQIQNISNKINILTTDNSNFGVGFTLFLWFCISSIVLSAIMENKELTKKGLM